MATWYCEDDGTSHVFGWSSKTKWAANTAYSVGDLRIQLAAPTVNNERVFLCVVAGTSHNTTEPTWTIAKGGSTTDNTVTWKEVTGQPAVNGDATNTPVWTASTNYALTSPIVKNTAGTYYFIVTTDAGSSGSSEPTWDTTTGHTTVDSGITWTCIGAVGAFSGYGAPFARLYPLLNSGWATAGETIYVSSRHAETQSSSLNLTCIYSYESSPIQIICVDYANVPPTALATSGSVTVTGANYLIVDMSAYVYGLIFNFGNNSSSYLEPSTGNIAMESCTLSLAASGIIAGNASSSYTQIKLKNCTFTYTTGGSVAFRGPGRVEICGGSISNYIQFPFVSYDSFGPSGCELVLRDIDMSTCTSYIFNATNFRNASIRVENCKLGSGVTAVYSTPHSSCDGFYLYNCDSANTNYRYYVSKYIGTIQHETTTVRTGGASNGTTGVSWKFVTNTNVSLSWPLESDPIARWNETTGSALTATIEIAGAASLTDANVWLEIEYLSDASSPKASIVSTRKGLLAAAAAVTTSTAAWSGSPTYTQKLQATFTPQKKGPVIARVYVAKASATVYVDPMLTIS